MLFFSKLKLFAFTSGLWVSSVSSAFSCLQNGRYFEVGATEAQGETEA